MNFKISGSGHSPNSVHPGSPPGILAPPPGFMSSKRPGYYEGSDGLQTKRPRISHYRKPETNTRTTASGVASANNSSNSNGSSGTNNSSAANINNSGCPPQQVNVPENNWEQRPNQRSRVDYRSERTINSDVLRSSFNPAGESCKTPTSDYAEMARNSNNSNSNHQLSVSYITKHNSQSSSSSRHHSHVNDNIPSTSTERLSLSSAATVVAGGVSPADAARKQRDERLKSDRGRERVKEIRESREINSVNTNTHNEFDRQASNYADSIDNTTSVQTGDAAEIDLDKYDTLLFYIIIVIINVVIVIFFLFIYYYFNLLDVTHPLQACNKEDVTMPIIKLIIRSI